MPLAFVVLAGCVSVLPAPVAVRLTLAPLIRFPLASRAVTVMVDAPLPAVIEVGDAVTVDCEADTGPGVTVTLAVGVIATPPAVAEIVFPPVLVELNVAVNTPLPLVVPVAGLGVFPVPPVSVRLTLAPLIRFPLPSRAVTVMVDAPLPAVIEVGDAVTVDCEADTGPGVTVTAAVWLIATPLIVAEIVFPPVPVELNVAVNTPLASVLPVAGASAFPVPPVTVRLTLAPLIVLPLASRAVTVIVELPAPTTTPVPAATPLRSEADTAPGVTVTLAVWLIATPPIVAEIVFPPVLVELNVAVNTPLPLVVPVAG